MNKAQLIDAIAQKGGAHRDGGISKAVAEAVVNSLTAIIEHHDGRMDLVRYGEFLAALQRGSYPDTV